MKKFKIDSLISPVFGLVAGILLSSILFIAWGSNPIVAFQGLLTGAFGSVPAISNTLNKSIPLILCGLAVVVSYKTGIFNIGAESQLYFGAIGATYMAINLSALGLPPLIHILICILFGMLLGGILGAIPGYLKAYKGINEVVVTMLLNYIAVFFVSAAVQPGGFLHEPGTTANQSSPIPVELHLYSGILKNVHIGLVIAIVIAFITWWFLKNHSTGFKMRSIGFNPKAAQYAGMNNKLLQTKVMLVSGAIAGLAGALEMLGYHHRLLENFSVGVGYTAIAVALLANLNPLGVIISAIFFAMLSTGANTMQIVSSVPASFGVVIQGVVIFFVVAGAILPKEVRRILEKRRVNKNG